MPESRTLSYSAAIHEALTYSLESYPEVVLIGEGVPDPKGIFATTTGLRERFGAERILDMPLAENGMTGICIGAALHGMRPVLVHQRIDFALLAMDQMVNNAAKWHFMFNGQAHVPLVIRMIIGRGWGQGPQHSQHLHGLFAQIPGLKVVMPATAHDAKGMMIAAIEDNNPVLFIEHRWLHPMIDFVPERAYRCALHGAVIRRCGDVLTIAALSHMVIEAMRVAEVFADHGFEIEIIDVRSVNPLDTDNILDSITRTGKLLVADTACGISSPGNRIISQVIQSGFDHLTAAPRLLATPDHPVPTSHFLAEKYYPGAIDIAQQVIELIDGVSASVSDVILQSLSKQAPSDVPDKLTIGPF